LFLEGLIALAEGAPEIEIDLKLNVYVFLRTVLKFGAA